jgi:hypothetical protein
MNSEDALEEDSWRKTSIHFVDTGRELSLIEGNMKTIAATAVADQGRALEAVRESLRAARRLVTHLDRLRFTVEGK